MSISILLALFILDSQVPVYIISSMKQFTQDINQHEHYLVTLDDKTITIDWHGRDNQLRPASTTVDETTYDTTELADRMYRRLQVCNGLERKLHNICMNARRK